MGRDRRTSGAPAAPTPPARTRSRRHALAAPWLAALWLAVFAAPAAYAQPAELPRGTTVKVCEDDAEWPPFTYLERHDERKGPRIVGAAVDALARILGPAGVRYTVELLPWTRCLESIKAGTHDMALNASYADERARDFLMSRAVYELDSDYYYSRQAHPQGLGIHTLADLKRWRVCGLLGYNYATYGLQPQDLDLSPPNFALMLRKISHGRCDVFVEKRQIIAGLGLIDPLVHRELANPDIVAEPVPGVPPTPFYMIVSRATPHGPALLHLLDEGIGRLRGSGEMRQIIATYTAALGR
jgi:polar amino acid transport system substrate-binding protein